MRVTCGLTRVLLGVGEIFSELETIEGKKYGEDIHSKIRYQYKITTVGLGTMVYLLL